MQLYDNIKYTSAKDRPARTESNYLQQYFLLLPHTKQSRELWKTELWDCSQERRVLCYVTVHAGSLIRKQRLANSWKLIHIQLTLIQWWKHGTTISSSGILHQSICSGLVSSSETLSSSSLYKALQNTIICQIMAFLSLSSIQQYCPQTVLFLFQKSKWHVPSHKVNKPQLK